MTVTTKILMVKTTAKVTSHNSEDDNDLSGLNSALLQRKISSEEKSFVFLFRVVHKWMLSIF